MADLPIASAAVLTGAGTASGDLFPMLDVSAAAGLKGSSITRDELRIAMGLTGGGILATGGFTLTVPATGTAALLGTANVFTTTQTVNAASGTLLDAQLSGSSVFKVTTSTIIIGRYVGFGNGSGDITWQGQYGTGSWIQGGGNNWRLSNPLGTGGGYFEIDNGGSNITRLSTIGTGMLQLGIDAAGVTNQTFKACNRITSDGVGANLTIAGGNGRGGAGGSLILSTYSTAGAATIGTLTTRLTLDTTGLLTFADAVDMAFNTTTGTKIGTAAIQKIGFWNATPVVQPTTGGSTSSFSAGMGTPVLEDSTFDGYTISGVVSALRNIGILA